MSAYQLGVSPSPGFVNGTIVNGIANFTQSTKPTTRADGSALVVGDKWYKSDEGTEWFWNGTYWLSDAICHERMVQTSIINTNSTVHIWPITGLIKSPTDNLFCTAIGMNTRLAAIDELNQWQVIFYLGQTSNSRVSTIASHYLFPQQDPVSLSFIIEPNVFIPSGFREFTSVDFIRIGAPPSLFSFNFYIKYHVAL